MSLIVACGADKEPAGAGAGGMQSGGGEGGSPGQGGSAGTMDAGEGGSAGTMPGGMGGAGGTSGGAGGSGGSTGGDCSGIDLQTDPDHCGECRHSCRGAACAEGLCEPTILIDDYVSPTEFTIDATAVYFLDSGNLSSVPKAGGTPTLLLEPELSVREIQVHDGRVYYAREADDEEDTEGVYSIPIEGGTETTVFEGLDEPLHGLSVRDERVFFMGGCADVWGAPRAGGMPERITLTSCNAFSGPFTASPSGRHGYYAEHDSLALMEIDLETAETRMLESNFYSRNILATDTTVYFAVRTNCEGSFGDRICHGGWIEAIDLADGNDELLLDLASIEKPEGYEDIGPLALDDKDLFFELIEVGHQERRLFAVARTGGPARLLAVLEGSAGADIEVDEAFVYVLHDGGRLHRVPK